MHRLIVALLATVDAALAVAVGLAATLAPLTMLWVFGFGGTADWAALWPAAVALWQLGNLVPLNVVLPPEYLAATGVDAAAASFTVSLAPLAFATFTAVFAARSAVRASRADAWLTGVLTASLVFAALTTGVALTSQTPVASVQVWQAIVLPALVFAVPALLAAVVAQWREADHGRIAELRERVEQAPHGWAEVPGLVARGAAVVVTGLVGFGALVVAVALFARAGQIVALFQAGNVDALGAIVLTLAHAAYLPTLAVWGLSFVAGPGFAVGEAATVSPAGTQVGVIPALPVLGAVPESTTPWLLLLALAPVGLGAFAGWIARSRLVRRGEHERIPRPGHREAPSRDAARTSVLEGLLASTAAERTHADGAVSPDGSPEDEHPVGARLAIAVGTSVVAAAAVALLAAAASGSLGPGRLSHFGPEPGPLALAVGLEVMLGAAILLVSPRGRAGTRAEKAESGAGTPHRESAAAEVGPAVPAEARTEPIELPRLD